MMFEVSNVYALRMASVFMFSLSTVWRRTRSMPQWLPLVTAVMASALLLVTSRSLWFTLLFPAWVLSVSLVLLVRDLKSLGRGQKRQLQQ